MIPVTDKQAPSTPTSSHATHERRRRERCLLSCLLLNGFFLSRTKTKHENAQVSTCQGLITSAAREGCRLGKKGDESFTHIQLLNKVKKEIILKVFRGGLRRVLESKQSLSPLKSFVVHFSVHLMEHAFQSEHSHHSNSVLGSREHSRLIVDT